MTTKATNKTNNTFLLENSSKTSSRTNSEEDSQQSTATYSLAGVHEIFLLSTPGLVYSFVLQKQRNDTEK